MGLFSKKRSQKQIYKLVSEVYDLSNSYGNTDRMIAEMMCNAGFDQQQTTEALQFVHSGKANKFTESTLTDDQVTALAQQHAKQSAEIYNSLKFELLNLEKTAPQFLENSLLDYLQSERCYN